MKSPAEPVLAAKGRPRRTAHHREQRRIRIMALVRSGYSYDEIARREQLSRERIRQIVMQSLDTGPSPSKLDHARVQIARLEPALQLAASAIEKGKLGGVTALLRVLERLDAYGATTAAIQEDYKDIHERLMRKLGIEIEKLPRSERGEDAARGEDGEGEDGEEDAGGL
jgi:transposase